MPVCPLCREERAPGEFRDSHIIPEFLYQDLYDEQHSLMVLAIDGPKRPQRRHQGTYEEHFLCAVCESRIAAHEDYVAKRLNSRVSAVKAPDAVRFTGFNYTHMKLFQMSILWRASASSRPEFRGVVLGPREERLRQMVASDDPGTSADFPCVLVTNRSLSERFGRQLIVPGTMARDHDGQRVVQFYVGGLLWWFFVSKVAAQSPRAPYFLREDGVLSIIRSDDVPWKFFSRQS